MFILTFSSIVLILSRWKARCIVDGFNVNNNNWNPFLLVSRDLNDSPNYDITRWVWQLHLQQCAFVEIGEGFCAVSRKCFTKNTFLLAKQFYYKLYFRIVQSLNFHAIQFHLIFSCSSNYVAYLPNQKFSITLESLNFSL